MTWTEGTTPAGGTMRRIRRARDITQADLAARLAAVGHPITHQQVSHLETGRRVPPLPLLRAWVDLLQVQGPDLDALVRGWAQHPWKSADPYRRFLALAETHGATWIQANFRTWTDPVGPG